MRQRYSDTQIINVLQAGARDIGEFAKPILSSTTVSLIQGTTCYDFTNQISDSLLDVKRVLYCDGTKTYSLPETTVEQLDSNVGAYWRSSGGKPQNYFFDNIRLWNICFEPWPDTTVSTNSYATIQFYLNSSNFSDTTQEPFGALNIRFRPYHDLFIWYACADIFMIEGDVAKAQYYRALYDSRLTALRDQIYKKENYTPGFSGPGNSR